jgi:hypothetical protein
VLEREHSLLFLAPLRHHLPQRDLCVLEVQAQLGDRLAVAVVVVVTIAVGATAGSASLLLLVFSLRLFPLPLFPLSL